MITTGYGVVNAWECDENDHFNVQFYGIAMHEAAGHLRLALGLTPTNRPDADYWVKVKEDHFRYLSELRLAERFHIISGITDWSAASMTATHQLTNSQTNEVAATMTSVWCCIDPESGGTRDWPNMDATKLEALRTELPSFARRRSAGVSPPPAELTLLDPRVEKIPTTNLGIFEEREGDATHTVPPQILFTKMGVAGANSWANLDLDWRRLKDEGRGTVVLENYLNYGEPFRGGDPYLCKSLIREVGGKSISFRHLLFNPATGKLHMYTEITAVLFDLAMRKAIEPSQQERAKIEAAQADL